MLSCGIGLLTVVSSVLRNSTIVHYIMHKEM